MSEIEKKLDEVRTAYQEACNKYPDNMSVEELQRAVDELRPAVEPPVPNPVPERLAEPDPFAHLIGQADPNADKDPFALMLDGMLADEGVSKDAEVGPKTDSFDSHEWEFKAELVYEEDQVEAICKKCFRQMRMERTQTWNEAMEAHGVNPDCGQMVVQDTMEL